LAVRASGQLESGGGVFKEKLRAHAAPGPGVGRPTRPPFWEREITTNAPPNWISAPSGLEVRAKAPCPLWSSVGVSLGFAVTCSLFCCGCCCNSTPAGDEQRQTAIVHPIRRPVYVRGFTMRPLFARIEVPMNGRGDVVSHYG